MSGKCHFWHLLNLYLEFPQAICLDNLYVHVGHLYNVTLYSCTNGLLESLLVFKEKCLLQYVM